MTSIFDGRVARAVDASGLFCPMPIARLAEALRAVGPGEVVELISTDPGTPGDLAAFCRATRHVLLATRAEGARLTAWVQKKVQATS